MNDVIEIDGQKYKIGDHGKVFLWRDGEWVFTKNYTAKELERTKYKAAKYY